MADICLTAEEYCQLAGAMVKAAEAKSGQEAQTFHLYAMLFSALGALAHSTRLLGPEEWAAYNAFICGSGG